MDRNKTISDQSERGDYPPQERVKAMKFTLEIEMGNEAMETPADIAQTTRLLFSDFFRQHEPAEENHGSFYDANGNKVGTWALTD